MYLKRKDVIIDKNSTIEKQELYKVLDDFLSSFEEQDKDERCYCYVFDMRNRETFFYFSDKSVKDYKLNFKIVEIFNPNNYVKKSEFSQLLKENISTILNIIKKAISLKTIKKTIKDGEIDVSEDNVVGEPVFNQTEIDMGKYYEIHKIKKDGDLLIIGDTKLDGKTAIVSMLSINNNLT